MRVLTILLTAFLVSCYIPSLCAEPNKRELLIGISFSIPPYVIKELNSGLELEILRQVFKVNGYTVLPSYLPLARTFMHFQEGSIDGVINVKKGMVKGFYTDVVVIFKNYAVSLQERQLEINNIQALSNKSVGAFQRAKSILGTNFHNAVQNNSNYSEWADQSIQLKQLYKYRVEVIVLEQKIFKYYRKKLFDRSLVLGGQYFISQSELRKPVIFHDIFTPSEYRFAFISEQVRDHFNEGLRLIKKNGVYDNIMKKYAEDFSLPLAP